MSSIEINTTPTVGRSEGTRRVTTGQAALLGLLQGATEFFPVSSSGHLFLVGRLMETDVPDELSMAVVFHIASALAIITRFRRDLPRLFGKDRRDLRLIALALVPTAALGLILRGSAEAIGTKGIAAALLGTALVLVIGDLATHKETRPNRASTALLVGFAQGVAVLPGLSRSGWTIAAGLAHGLSREDAVRFSFLLAVPSILAAGTLLLAGGNPQSRAFPDPITMMTGFVTSFGASYAALSLMMRLIPAWGLAPFAGYLVLVGGVALLS